MAGAATSIIFVATNKLSRQVRVYRDQKSLLSRKKYACRDKIMFVATKEMFCHDKHVFVKHVFVATKLVTTNICREKHNFVATSILLSQQTRVCRDKTILLFSRQKYTCCDITFFRCLSRQNFCRDKHNFVAINIFLSRQKTCFVVTNTLLAAAPANDRSEGGRERGAGMMGGGGIQFP